MTYLWLLIGLPALAGVALLLAPLAFRVADRVVGVLSLAVASALVGLAIVVAVERPAVAAPFVAGTDFALHVGGLAAAVVPAVAVVTLLVLVFATGDAEVAGGRFHGLMLLFASAVLVTATAATLPALLLAWEIMGATSYALIGFHWHDDFRVSAGLTAFLTTRAADLGLYLAAGAGLAGGAGLVLADLPAAEPVWRNVAAAGVLVAALGKAAQLPFSFWLSKAMEGPSPVSALLHSAAMVAMGAYLLLRVEPLLSAVGWAGAAAAWFGVATAVVLGAVAVAQSDLKQLLAASTSAQLGFVVMAAGVAAIGGGAAQLVAHAFTKAGLFLAAGVFLSLLGTKQLDDLRGVARRWPVLGVTVTVAALALAGVAPLSLWATKDAVLAVAREHSGWLYAAGLVAAALSAAYAAKIIVVIWRPGRAADLRGRASPGAFQRVPLAVLAVGAAAGGVLVLPPVESWLQRTVNAGPTPHPSVIEMVGSAVLALAVVLAVWRWGVPQPRWAASWLGLERAAHLLTVRPAVAVAHALARFDDRVLDRGVDLAATGALRLAHSIARFDDRVLDRGVDLAATGALRLARGAARVDTGGVDRAVEGVAARMRRLGELARKPQTGLLHRYYLAAVVVLAAAVLLLVVLR
jgi:NADH:ubiquinone oxidoreductase subunit 5 (subunit L)/multisubunit Na+/H+ antiporter MnhA subunit